MSEQIYLLLLEQLLADSSRILIETVRPYWYGIAVFSCVINPLLYRLMGKPPLRALLFSIALSLFVALPALLFTLINVARCINPRVFELPEAIAGRNLQRGETHIAGGVCTGIANAYGINKSQIRGIFIVLALISNYGILLYALIWLLMPPKSAMREISALK